MKDELKDYIVQDDEEQGLSPILALLLVLALVLIIGFSILKLPFVVTLIIIGFLAVWVSVSPLF